MTRTVAVVLLFGTASLVGRADVADAAKKLDGTYAVVSAVVAGQPDAERFAKAELTFKGGAVTMSEKGRIIQESTIKVDPAKTPAWIDVADKRGGRSGDVRKGVYQTRTTPDGFELTLAVRLDDAKMKDRPKDFKGDEDTIVLKLIRKEAK
ncbi:TIGR03067 domain-containing protein [bacterium]|nr:TIGR03067 domain-containing protein [bacterium]